MLSDKEFPIYHIWISKKRLAENDLYRRFTVMRLAEYMGQYFPECYMIMMNLSEMEEVRELFKENQSARQAVENGNATDILWN